MGSGSSKGAPTTISQGEAKTVNGGGKKGIIPETTNNVLEEFVIARGENQTVTTIKGEVELPEESPQSNGDGDDIAELNQLRGELDLAIKGQDEPAISSQENDSQPGRYSKGISQYYKPTAKVWAIPQEIAQEERRIKEKEVLLSKNSTKANSESPSLSGRKSSESNEDEGFGSTSIENGLIEKNGSSKTQGFDANKFKLVNLKGKRSNEISKELNINDHEETHVPIISELEPKSNYLTPNDRIFVEMQHEEKSSKSLPKYDTSELNLIDSIEKEFDI